MCFLVFDFVSPPEAILNNTLRKFISWKYKLSDVELNGISIVIETSGHSKIKIGAPVSMSRGD